MLGDDESLIVTAQLSEAEITFRMLTLEDSVIVIAVDCVPLIVVGEICRNLTKKIGPAMFVVVPPAVALTVGTPADVPVTTGPRAIQAPIS